MIYAENQWMNAENPSLGSVLIQADCTNFSLDVLTPFVLSTSRFGGVAVWRCGRVAVRRWGGVAVWLCWGDCCWFEFEFYSVIYQLTEFNQKNKPKNLKILKNFDFDVKKIAIVVQLIVYDFDLTTIHLFVN